MNRRAFISLVGAAVAPLATRAQQPGVSVVGYLSSLRQADSAHFDDALRRGLADAGYVASRNVAIDYRWITERYDPLPAMAAELVQRQVPVSLATAPPAGRSA